MSEQLPNLDPALLGDPPPSPGTGRASSCSTARPASAPSAACWCWRPHACSNASVPKRGFSTLPGCHCPDDAPVEHPKVRELRDLVQWSEGQVWCSPERHGALSAVFKAQIDWIPLALGAVRLTQGKTLAVMQVCGGSQSFNVVNQLRVLGRWMRMFTIPTSPRFPRPTWSSTKRAG